VQSATDLAGLFSATSRAGRQPAQPESATPIRWDFDRVLPAPENYPLEFLKEAAADALGDPDSLTYEATRLGNREKTLGNEGLRQQIAAWVSARQGVELDLDNVVLTSGAAQANALNVAALVDPGDGVVVESWTWPSMIRFLQMREGEIRGAEIDADGVVPESVDVSLRELRVAGSGPKLL
jgi:2-aminoadipate transaminase